MLPVEDEAGVAGELLEEGALCAAVALAERVDGVDLTASLRDGDGAELASPVVDVAEDPAVDRAQVAEVVAGPDG